MCSQRQFNCISFISLGNEVKQSKVAFLVLFWSLNYWPVFQAQKKQLMQWLCIYMKPSIEILFVKTSHSSLPFLLLVDKTPRDIEIFFKQ